MTEVGLLPEPEDGTMLVLGVGDGFLVVVRNDEEAAARRKGRYNWVSEDARWFYPSEFEHPYPRTWAEVTKYVERVYALGELLASTEADHG